ncbi:MAG: urease accessory protein UreF [Steroidobacteraceae bacterium]
MAESLAVLRLLQLTSPALPIGAYNFSQGLEWAVDAGWVRDEADLLGWCRGLLHHSVGTLDVPLLLKLRAAFERVDDDGARSLSARLLASRETAELRAEERHLARALAKVLIELRVDGAATWRDRPEATYAALFALASLHGAIPREDVAQGYLWAWCENQVLAALKLMALGQSAGQRVLDALLTDIPEVARRAATLDDDDIGTSAPRAAMASAWHEHQYSRLFRS